MTKTSQADTSGLPQQLIQSLREHCPGISYEFDEYRMGDELARFRFAASEGSDYGFDVWIYDGDVNIGSIAATIGALDEGSFTWSLTLETWDCERTDRGVDQFATTVLALLTHETRIVLRQRLMVRHATLRLRVGEDDAIELRGWSQLWPGKPKRADYRAQPQCVSDLGIGEDDLVPATHSVFFGPG